MSKKQSEKLRGEDLALEVAALLTWDIEPEELRELVKEWGITTEEGVAPAMARLASHLAEFEASGKVEEIRVREGRLVLKVIPEGIRRRGRNG